MARRGIIHDMDRGDAGSANIVLCAHVNGHRKKLGRWQCARRRGADRVVIGDHRRRFHRSVRNLGEGGGGQGSFDGAVDGRQSVDGRELAGSRDGRFAA